MSYSVAGRVIQSLTASSCLDHIDWNLHRPDVFMACLSASAIAVHPKINFRVYTPHVLVTFCANAKYKQYVHVIIIIIIVIDTFSVA